MTAYHQISSLISSDSELAVLASKIQRDLEVNPLTEIERQVCRLLSRGRTAKQIALVRECSRRTVERHIANVKSKVEGAKLSPAVLCLILDLGAH